MAELCTSKTEQNPFLVLLCETNLYATEDLSIFIHMSFSDLIVCVQLFCLILWRN